tara:strand:+ start:1043 stop:1432 length:390 start_codon:yes stop_codon:yes gene_type:complete
MPTTISKLKKKLDVLFSQYIRLRNADHLGRVKCFTCGVEKHWKELQAGHFQSRSHHSTRWDEVNVQVQCVKCNMFRQGEQYKFGLYLDDRYGDGTAEELEQRAKTIVKLNRVDYEEAVERYKKKIKELS